MNPHEKQSTPLGADRFGRRAAWRALGMPLLVLVMAAFHATAARADMWSYVDAQGISHFSSTQLDKRYQLLFRGVENLVAGADSAGGEPGRSASGLKSSARKFASLDASPDYKAVQHLLVEASQTHGIDYDLLKAVIATESGFNAQAVSPKGAIGLMQVIPPTAERYGVRTDKNSAIQTKLADPRTNIRAGSSYLSYLIKLFPGQLELAIAAYNAGEGAVQRAGNKIPNYPETINYVKTVMQRYNQFKLPGQAGASTQVAKAGGRVRMEMMGGATGRGNMVPAAVASRLLAEETTALD